MTHIQHNVLQSNTTTHTYQLAQRCDTHSAQCRTTAPGRAPSLRTPQHAARGQTFPLTPATAACPRRLTEPKPDQTHRANTHTQPCQENPLDTVRQMRAVSQTRNGCCPTLGRAYSPSRYSTPGSPWAAKCTILAWARKQPRTMSTCGCCCCHRQLPWQASDRLQLCSPRTLHPASRSMSSCFRSSSVDSACSSRTWYRPPAGRIRDRKSLNASYSSPAMNSSPSRTPPKNSTPTSSDGPHACCDALGEGSSTSGRNI